MMSSRPSPLWPYLLLLASLFALTVAIPAWQSGKSASSITQRPVAEQPPRTAANERQLASVMVVRPLSPAEAAAEYSVNSPDAGSQTVSATRGSFSNLIRGPLVEAVAKKIADLRRFGGRGSATGGNQPADRVVDFPTTHISANPFPSSPSLASSSNPTNGIGSLIGGAKNIAMQSILTRSNGSSSLASAVTTHWALPHSLLDQLNSVSQIPGCTGWANRTESLCRDLSRLSADDGAKATEIIGQLRLQADQAAKLAGEQTSPIAATELRRVHYAIQRRLALWQPAIGAPDHTSIFANIVGGDGQMGFVEVDDVLANIERYEQFGLVSDARIIAASQQQLKYSNLQAQRDLAAEIDEHYRNANVRMAFTGELLSRLLPDQSPISGIVNDRILGTPVHGVSDTTTRLQVRLIPDSERIHLWLEARGTVDSLTSASRGPVTLTDRGQSAYIVHKAVIIDERGMGIAKAMAEADSSTELTGISTRFDSRPLVSAVVRDRAAAKYEKQHAAALREVDQRVADQAARRVDSDARQALEDIEAMIVQQMFSPLERMGVEAQPISFATNAERVSMRLRLAGENQLGGHTARPQAPSDSLASMQMHESALNNVLDQLELAGNTFTLPDLFIHLAKRTGKPIAVPHDLPEDTTITFATRDPVHVRCQNGTIRVTLAVQQLQQRDRSWHDFSISAHYAPEIDHLHARLVRSGPIELGGDTYKGQAEVALRTIFSTVFPRDRKLDLVPSMITDNARLSGLSLTQCVIEDGWIGIAIGQDRTALRSSSSGWE